MTQPIPNLWTDSAFFYLKEMLMGQVAARVQLENEHVVDPSLPPAVGVNAQQEEELDKQEAAAVKANQGPDVTVLNQHNACVRTKPFEQSVLARVGIRVSLKVT